MTIYSSNTNAAPMNQWGAFGRTAYTSAYYEETAKVPGTTMTYDDSGQVVGLVPVFPCCNREATGTISFQLPESAVDAFFTITLPTGTTAQFSANGNQTAAAVEAAIQAILPAGYTVVITKTDNGSSVVFDGIIYAPSGTGSDYNGEPCVLNRISGTDTYSSTNFAGGYGDSLCDCREGEYGADALPDATQFPLPVFAQSVPGSTYDPYYNDFNSFLFETPAISTTNTYRFFLDQKQGDTYVEVARLNTNTYGTFFNVNTLCSNLIWKGFTINWSLVLQTFGEGNYKFRMMKQVFSRDPLCYSSPPFCLQEWECKAVERTTKFQATYSGGIFGSINKGDCGGKSWTFCCKTQVDGRPKLTSPILWNDSIRIEGMFGYEEKTFERSSIKYTTGLVKKIRDEAIRNFTWKSGNLPFWFHDRFAVYGLMADRLLVSDYNLNNADYTIKTYCVIANSDYSPKYKGYSRYTKVDVKFQSQNQYLIRTRCC